MTEQNFKNLLKEIISVLSPRSREVMEKRFGLSGSKRFTLEAIGKQFGITRERVRQIESEGLKHLNRDAVLEKLEPVFQLVAGHLKNCGGIRREDLLLEELGNGLFFGEKNSANFVNFVLTLGRQKLARHEGDDNLHPAWALSDGVCHDAADFVSCVKKQLASGAGLLSHDILVDTARIEAAKFSVLNTAAESLLSYLALSKHVAKNPFGEWGLIDSPEVSPRGVKDKAYLVFKREKQPLHFREVCNLINKMSGNHKAHPQTVHNELIKDKRFVLVGRGTYALRDWGYEPGTVRDIMVSVLKKARSPLSREEVVKQVISQRLVKENTILLNLQNRKVFKKTGENKFTLA